MNEPEAATYEVKVKPKKNCPWCGAQENIYTGSFACLSTHWPGYDATQSNICKENEIRNLKAENARLRDELELVRTSHRGTT